MKKRQKTEKLIRIAAVVVVAACTYNGRPTFNMKKQQVIRNVSIIVCPYDASAPPFRELLENDIRSDYPVITVWRITRDNKFCPPNSYKEPPKHGNRNSTGTNNGTEAGDVGPPEATERDYQTERLGTGVRR